MNGLENMTQKILGEAKRYAEEQKKSSDLKVDEILLDYKAQADALSSEAADAAKKEAEITISRAKGQAALTVRNELLRAKREIIDSVFSMACDALVGLPREDYLDLLCRLVQKYQTGPAEIILNERDAKELGSDLLKKVVINKLLNIDISMVKISKTYGSFKGGLILRQGDIDTNCTVEVLCEGLRHELEPEVIRRLQF